MPLKGQSLTITITAWNAQTGKGQAGDAANLTLRLVRDGALATPANAPAEVSAVNAPGEYSLTLTAAEMGANSITVAGISATANVSVIPIKIFTDQGVMPAVAPGSAGGMILYGTGVGQLNPTAGNVTATITGYASGQDPGTYVLSTPAYKIVTNSSGQVTTSTTGGGGGTSQMDFTQSVPTTYMSGTMGGLMFNLNKIGFDASYNVKSLVNAYATGFDPGTYILVTPSQKIVTNASGQVTTSNPGGGGGVVTLDFTQAYPTTPTAGTVGAAMANAGKFGFDASSNVKALVNAYASGFDPATSILVTPSQKIVTNASGYVTTSNPGGGTGTLDFTQVYPTTPTAGTVGAAMAGAGKLGFDASNNVKALVNAYASGFDPGTYVLVTPAQKLVTNASGQVTTSNPGGGGTVTLDFTQAYPTTPTAGTVGAAMSSAGKIGFDVSGNVKSQVNSYVSGQDPATYILVTPSQKIVTDASGSVTTSNPGGGAGGVVTLDFTQAYPTTPTAGTVGAAMANAGKFGFDASGNVMAFVNAYAAGKDPASQVLLTASNRIAADGSGKVTAVPVILDVGGFVNVTIDGVAYLTALENMAAQLYGAIAYDPATGTVTASSISNPNVIRLTYTTDTNFLSRSQIVSTP